MTDILIGTFGLIGYTYSDSHTAVDLMNGTVKVELTVTFDALRSPCSVVCPADIIQREDLSVVGPVDHILC